MAVACPAPDEPRGEPTGVAPRGALGDRGRSRFAASTKAQVKWRWTAGRAGPRRILPPRAWRRGVWPAEAGRCSAVADRATFPCSRAITTERVSRPAGRVSRRRNGRRRLAHGMDARFELAQLAAEALDGSSRCRAA